MLRRLMMAGGAGVYLDNLAVAPRCVLSLKKLISNASKSIRVRRSSDNAEQDIGFSGNVLDTAALLSFVGAGSGFVSTWYDQTGNNEDAVSSSNALQPRIVNAGVFDSNVMFLGSQGLKIISLTLGTPQVGLYSKYYHTPNASGIQVVGEMTTVGSSNNGTFLIYTNIGDSFLDSYNTGAGTNRARQMAPATVMASQTYLMDRSISGSAELAVFLDGAVRSSTEPVVQEQTGNYLTNDFYLGARAESSLFATIAMNSILIYNADTSAIRTSIEAFL